jgi:hypothetical protein
LSATTTQKKTYMKTSTATATTTNTTTLSPIAAALLTVPAGQFVGVSWSRPMKTRKGVADTVTKSVRSTVQVGAKHDNRAAVIAARENGNAPAENQGLPWGQWVDGMENRLIEHKGAFYLRLYPVHNSDGTPRACKTVFRLNGKTVSRAVIESLCLASEFAEKKEFACYTLGEKNLTAVRSVRRTS